MFFLIGKNHPYYDDLYKNINENLINKQIEALEIKLKNKYNHLQDFNPEDCYNNSIDSDEEGLEQLDSDSFSVSVQSKEIVKNSNSLLTRGTQNRGYLYFTDNRLLFLKKIIKIFDVLAVIMIIFGAILSQYEHEVYYYHNIFYRVAAVVMINYAYKNPKNHSLNYIFDDNLVNLTNLTYNSIVYLFDSNISTYDYPTNALFLSKLNMSKFNYTDNVTSYNNIQVPLEVSSDTIRLVLLFTTIASCVLVFLSRYLEHRREYFYKKKSDGVFYFSEFFFYAVIEIFIILPVQYPGLNSYIIFTQLGSTICMPVTSILASINIFRFIFLYKLVGHFTIWNSEMAEIKCEKYICTADRKFAFKAFQKEYPLATVMIIFGLTCVCLGFSLRNFELHYWEAQTILSQNWRYHVNAIWCVFISMTTIGYGDFYPKTHLGRFIIVTACIIGIYFVSIMIVFMTQKGILNSSEEKVYKLITRLKLRNEIKNDNSHIISHAFQLALLKYGKSKNLLKEKEYEIKYNYEKQSIISLINKIKQKNRNIKHFEFKPTKEQLFDICECIDTDIKEIKQEIEVLKYINESVMSYSESQVDMLRYLNKNIYATQLMYDVINRKPRLFGDLANYDKNVIFNHDTIQTNVELDNKIHITYQYKNNTVASIYLENLINGPKVPADKQINRIKPKIFERNYSFKQYNQIITKKQSGMKIINPNQFDENIIVPIIDLQENQSSRYNSDDDKEYYADELMNYNVTLEEIKEHFKTLFFDVYSIRKINRKDTIKSIKRIRNMKKTQAKLNMILNLRKSSLKIFNST